MKAFFSALLLALLFAAQSLHAGLSSAVARETAGLILEKFGRSAVGETVEQLTGATVKAVA